ncbi:MAG TPA: YciI family protein [Anaeromyxobacter sp.]|nr:YciI family protein [Anaeromyxobacter sp.]
MLDDACVLEVAVKAVLLYQSAPDVLTKAPIHFPAHKARVDEFHRRGDLLAVGTWADPREGSMAVFRTRQAAEEFVKDDPFVKNGVVASYQIKDWDESLLGG